MTALGPPAGGLRCALYRDHRPEPLRLVVHHIQPLAMGGPDVPANWTAPICDNCHYGIHRLLGAMILDQPFPTAGWAPLVEVAGDGFRRWVAAGKPGTPVLELDHPPAYGADQVPSRFQLHRDIDVSGVTGTGTVADGVTWPDGTVSIRWRGPRPSTVSWGNLDDPEAIHGHGGATRFVWLDEK